jgi:ribosome-associated heat shock protein Hsp15
MEQAQDPVRLDKWLWAARFFKTRSLASKAAAGGKIFLNGQRSKPSKGVAVGDTLCIHKGQQEFTIIIDGLSARRGPATVARELYSETEESMIKREQQSQERSLFYAGQSLPAKRPGKRDRRKIKEFIRKGE